MRNNLASHLGIITIVEQSKEIDDNIDIKINKETIPEEEIIPEEETIPEEITQNQILKSSDSKKYNFSITTQCPSIESLELINDPDCLYFLNKEENKNETTCPDCDKKKSWVGKWLIFIFLFHSIRYLVVN